MAKTILRRHVQRRKRERWWMHSHLKKMLTTMWRQKTDNQADTHLSR